MRLQGTKMGYMQNKYRLGLLFVLLLLLPGPLRSQYSDSTFVQFSGVVVTDDSLRPLPFVSISVEGSYRGTLTDLGGFFSIAARRNETLIFSSLGYKTVVYHVPDTLSKDRYTLIQVMRADTLYLDETFIYPWPTYEQFKSAFVKAEIPDDEMERARKNIEEIEARVVYQFMPMDGAMNYRNVVQRYTDKLYYAGQMPPNNLLNPFAWARFVKAWKEGKFKTKRVQ